MLRKTVGKVTKFGIAISLLFAFIQSCPFVMQPGWKPVSVENHAEGSDVVAVGKAIQSFPIDKSYASVPTYAVNFQLLYVLKGQNITNDIHASSRNSLFTIYGFGSPGQCLSSVDDGETYILFLIFESSTKSLVTAYNSPFGATAEPTKENEDRILTSLGWGPWSDWSKCSVTCGGGSQERKRHCRIRQCNEPVNEIRNCNKYDCKEVTNLLSRFKLGRNTRSIPTSRRKDAFRITNSGNLSVPTHKIFNHPFPLDFTMFASTKYMNYTQGYLISFYDSWERLQIGIKVNKTSVALVYIEVGSDKIKSAWELAFNVEIIDRKWHQFAFSVLNGTVSFYLDCDFIGAETLIRDGTNRVDTNGDTYLSGKTSPSQSRRSNIEFYIEQLSFSNDGSAGEDQCAYINDPYGYEEDEFSGDGVTESPEDVAYTWSPWTTCSHSCGTSGVKTRVKMCTDMSINHPKSECQEMIQYAAVEPCNRVKCPAYCQPNCMNGGKCINRNVCSCRHGYYGISCEKVVPCKRKCINGGRCIPSLGTCKCPKGFAGKYCEKASCYPPCQNGGICVKPGVCKCRQGYVPPLCKPSCAPSCMNQGTCVMPGRCHCRKGYSGYRCQLAICTKPCLNGGHCYNRDKCICKSGWMGETCDIAICHPKCLNGGYCRTPNRCSCPNEARGTFCQNVVCYPRCLNGGICVKGNRCVCSSWYRGYRCQTPLCRPQCRNGGKCVAPNQCVCSSGYFGDWCERRSCIYKTRVVPLKRTHRVPITTTYPKKCYHHWAWRPCTEERTEYRTVHLTSYRTIYYCG